MPTLHQFSDFATFVLFNITVAVSVYLQTINKLHLFVTMEVIEWIWENLVKWTPDLALIWENIHLLIGTWLLPSYCHIIDKFLLSASELYEVFLYKEDFYLKYGWAMIYSSQWYCWDFLKLILSELFLGIWSKKSGVLSPLSLHTIVH